MKFPALQSCLHGEHIKCSPARAELAINFTRGPRREKQKGWLVRVAILSDSLFSYLNSDL